MLTLSASRDGKPAWKAREAYDGQGKPRAQTERAMQKLLERLPPP